MDRLFNTSSRSVSSKDGKNCLFEPLRSFRDNSDLTTPQYSAGKIGKMMIHSESHSSQELAAFAPGMLPQPISSGNLESPGQVPGFYFLTTFINFKDHILPDVIPTARLVARMHSATLGTGAFFGSAVPIYDGFFCQVQTMESSWTILFSKIIIHAYQYDRRTNGPCEALDEAMPALVVHVIPRLLAQLERGENKIEPCFIHGDLWEGNIGEEVETKRMHVFDVNGYYAHNEMEFAYWRTPHHRMHLLDYCSEYHRYIPPSPPADEFEDRVKLYSIKASLMFSATEGTAAASVRDRFDNLCKRIFSVPNISHRALECVNYLLCKYPPASEPIANIKGPQLQLFNLETQDMRLQHDAETQVLLDTLK